LLFCYRLSPETFEYILLYSLPNRLFIIALKSMRVRYSEHVIWMGR